LNAPESRKRGPLVFGLRSIGLTFALEGGRKSCSLSFVIARNQEMMFVSDNIFSRK
jgi:hypothetical protein